MTTINLMMSGGQATDRYYLIEYLKKTLQPDIRWCFATSYGWIFWVNVY